MASKIECPRCGGVNANLIHGVCRACYMRDYHQRRTAAAVTECPKCGGISANFVHGVCRACYMRDYHQRRSAAAVTDKQAVLEPPTLIDDSAGQRLCVECKAPSIYARGRCLECYMRDRQRQRPPLCIECGEPAVYARRRCQNCYKRDRQHRQGLRRCVECAELGIYARGLCQNCYLRDRRRHHRMKFRACVVCGVSFQSVRRDAIYCSPGCRQKAHRVGKAQFFGMAAHAGERSAVQPATETQDATLAAIEAQAHAVADLGRRLDQVDSTIGEAAKRAPTNAVLSVIDGQRTARQVLAGGRRQASTLTDLKAERASRAAKARQAETEAAPIRYVAELVGADTNSEWALRWLLALIMLCFDPPARAHTAAASFESLNLRD